MSVNAFVPECDERSCGDIIGQPVLSIKEGADLGCIRQILLSGENYHVQGFIIVVRRGGNREEKILPFEHVSSFGTDGITVESQSRMERKGASHRFVRALRRPLSVIGARVFTAAGRNLGKVEEYRFSTEDGHITALEVSGGVLKERMLLDGRSLIAVSPQTVMLKDGAETSAIALSSPVSHLREQAVALKDNTICAARQLAGNINDAARKLREREQPADAAKENDTEANAAFAAELTPELPKKEKVDIPTSETPTEQTPTEQTPAGTSNGQQFLPSEQNEPIDEPDIEQEMTDGKPVGLHNGGGLPDLSWDGHAVLEEEPQLDRLPRSSLLPNVGTADDEMTEAEPQ